MLVTVYKVEFRSWKTLTAFTYSLLCLRLLPPLSFSLKHMVCHTSTPEISNGINTCHIKVFQYVRIKPHSSSLANVENWTSNFRQSVHLFAVEKKKKNNGDCKAFCVNRKRNNVINDCTKCFSWKLLNAYWLLRKFHKKL